ncbi:MAG: hypothetical protein CVT88_02660 [Candidatus Altiarchaeales archaeon HGW-Altiarchaeales-1]|nr:MAG: hypothetical protein CVT89_01325 [Candidatus Altiarchaeales archaeon HGW-Altiarchaeales-2]PKP60562.1 MAG: hypothetical protein CVT88_02660 [Candidatus Altiarchaeales archaeon HGW-Altiarchaeales-1]
MTKSVTHYFGLALDRITRTPRILIPYLFTMALPVVIWSIVVTVLILIFLPFAGGIADFLEENEDWVFDEYTDQKEYEKKFEENILENDLLAEFQVMEILLLITLPIIFIISLLLYSYIGGGTIGYVCLSTATGSSGMRFKNFLFYARKYFLRLFALNLLKILVFALCVSPIFIIALIEPDIVALLLVIIVPVLMLLFFFLFFTDEYIVIENLGVIDSITKSAGFVRNNFSSVVFFIFILIAVWVVYIIVFISSEAIAITFNSNISPMFYFLEALVISPWIHIAKITFFMERTNWNFRPVTEKRFNGIKYMWVIFRNSPNILKNFLICNLHYVFCVLAFCVTGFVIGYYMGSEFSFLGDDLMDFLILGEKESFFGYVSMPFIDTLWYFFNNSSVAIGTAFGGLFFGGVPAVLEMVINSCIVGAVYGILPFKITTAIIMPHGPFELFAFFISGVAGLKLGVHFITSSDNIDKVFDETLRIMFIVILFLVIAAFLEAFITPLLIHVVLG